MILRKCTKDYRLWAPCNFSFSLSPSHSTPNYYYSILFYSTPTQHPLSGHNGRKWMIEYCPSGSHRIWRIIICYRRGLGVCGGGQLRWWWWCCCCWLESCFLLFSSDMAGGVLVGLARRLRNGVAIDSSRWELARAQMDQQSGAEQRGVVWMEMNRLLYSTTNLLFAKWCDPIHFHDSPPSPSPISFIIIVCIFYERPVKRPPINSGPHWNAEFSCTP